MANREPVVIPLNPGAALAAHARAFPPEDNTPDAYEQFAHAGGGRNVKSGEGRKMLPLSSARGADFALFQALSSIKDPQQRAYVVSHLNDQCFTKLCRHLNNFVKQNNKIHKVSDGRTHAIVKTALQPHANLLKTLLPIAITNKKKKGAKRKRNVRRQKGGAILTAIVSAVAPLIVSLLANALSKKK